MKRTNFSFANMKSTLLAVFASLVLTAAAQAATYTVTKTADTNDGVCNADCSLREAIAAANANTGDDVIEFDAAIFGTPQVITLVGSQLTSITNSGALTINGTGADKLRISGNNAITVFRNDNLTARVVINGVTISNGRGSFGGGIANAVGCNLTLNNSVVRNNSATHTGGGFNTDGTLTLNNSTVSNNTASINGGGISNGGTISNGGGVTLNNSTVSTNSAPNGGGIDNGTFNDGSRLTLNSSTVSNNTASTGGGIRNVMSASVTTLNNSIVANSVSSSDCVRSSGTVNAAYSLIESGLTCVSGTNSNNLTGDPNLGPLQDNGGATQTHALLPGSIAIDAGNSTLMTDQRGLARPVDDPFVANAAGGNGSDIGSFEVQSADSDGDGFNDLIDNCPNIANADQADNDMDMIGDACDPDDDNDGVLDGNDAFPFDPNESVDTDGDGIGNNADTDDDNDGQTDANEMACGSNPLDAASKSPDADGDNIPDCVDTDDDNDGIPDTCDIDQNPGAVDFDRDGIVDSSACDTQIGPPVDKDQCKNGGYLRFNNPTFRNQGQCVSYVESRKP